MKLSKTKIALGVLAAVSAVFLWKRTRRRPEQIELFYEDGSLVSVEPGSAEGARMLPLARDAVRAARGMAAT